MLEDNKESGELIEELKEKELTPEIQKGIEDLITRMKSQEMIATEIKESVKALASKLGVKPKELQSRIKVIIDEEGEGGAIKKMDVEKKVITIKKTFVEKYMEIKHG